MSSVEELKKYKELLDAGIITEEDFEKKKNEVLSGGTQQESSETEVKAKRKIFKKTINKALLKKILIGVVILVVIAIAILAGREIIKKNKESKRASAVEKAIASIMDEYGLSPYKVKCENFGHDICAYHVYTEGMDNLTNGQALSCLTEIDNTSVKDPCGDGGINVDSVRMHPGLDVEYYYWRVTTNEALASQIVGDTTDTKPGIYCNQYGRTCVYECGN